MKTELLYTTGTEPGYTTPGPLSPAAHMRQIKVAPKLQVVTVSNLMQYGIIHGVSHKMMKVHQPWPVEGNIKSMKMH